MTIQEWQEFKRFAAANPHLSFAEAVEMYELMKTIPF